MGALAPLEIPSRVPHLEGNQFMKTLPVGGGDSGSAVTRTATELRARISSGTGGSARQIGITSRVGRLYQSVHTEHRDSRAPELPVMRALSWRCVRSGWMPADDFLP
jgi:hypothetical protein